MIDLQEMERNFIESRKSHNAELRLNQSGLETRFILVDDVLPYQHLKGFKIVEQMRDKWSRTVYKISYINECKPFREKEQPLDENPNLFSFTYNNGAGAMVIDLEQFNKFSKAKQKKILKLMEGK